MMMFVALLCLGWLAPVSAGEPRISGLVTDLLGHGMPGARLEVYRLDGGLAGTYWSDEQGRFSIWLPMSRTSLWRIVASAEGYRMAETGWYSPFGYPVQTLRLEPTHGDLRVVLRDDRGEPVNGRVLLARPGGYLQDEVVTDGGEHSWSGLRAMRYQIHVLASGHLLETREAVVQPGAAAVTAVVLRPGGLTVTGEVRDQRTGKPVAGSEVNLLTQENAVVETGLTGDDGRFAFRLALGRPQGLKLVALAEGYRNLESPVIELKPGEHRDFSGTQGFGLTPAYGRVAGVLLDRNGQVQAGAPVWLELKGLGVVAETRSGEGGRFSFDQVVAGPELSYRLVADWEQDWAATDWAPTEAGGLTQVVMRPESGWPESFGTGTISGVVVGPDGATVAGAKVELLRRTQAARVVVTDERGEFEFKNITATASAWYGSEPYRVKVSAEGFVTSLSPADRVTFDLAANRRESLKLVLARNDVRVTGRVTSASEGLAVRGAALSGGTFRTATDAEGLFTGVVNRVLAVPFVRIVVARPGSLPSLTIIPWGEMISADPRLSLSLVPARRRLTGLVPAGVGLEPSGARVQAEGAEGLVAEARAQEDGSFALQLPRGGGERLLLLTTDRAGRRLVRVLDPPAGHLDYAPITIGPPSQ